MWTNQEARRDTRGTMRLLGWVEALVSECKRANFCPKFSNFLKLSREHSVSL